MKQLLYKYIPKELVNRPKQGFEIPISEWLRSSLKEWGEDLLNSASLNKNGIFQSDIIQKKWLEHQSGERNWSYVLWTILMFQTWYEKSRQIKTC